MFFLRSPFTPTDDQTRASDNLVKGVVNGHKDQVLLGVTGSGKTFTVAQVIQKLQMPTLIVSHNKTLAGQLYQEMKDFFPRNAVSYFVSYYDYYQPEAYIPRTDTYIEKEADINELIEKLRLNATTSIMTRKDVIIVASVSCIYNIGSPYEYAKFVIQITKRAVIDTKKFLRKLVSLQYERSEFDFKRGTFRVRGDIIDVYPAYRDEAVRIHIKNEKISKIQIIDPLSSKVLNNTDDILLYPTKQYMVSSDIFSKAEENILRDLKKESIALKKGGKVFESERLIRKVTYDLEMIREMGYVNGIENYSIYFDGRSPGEPPSTLLDYYKYRYKNNWLVIIDESHMTIPQIRGMYNGDSSRKKTLIEYGFRLSSALDNRPLHFSEFYGKANNIIYLSATPSPWELEKSKKHIVEQLVRPTGIVDPKITIRNVDNEIKDLMPIIKKKIAKKQRVLITTLTKAIAEDLSRYLKEKGIKSAYLHSDIKTLKRTDLLHRLRKKKYDVLIGVNLLREGLDLPEVALVIILDGDKEGFLRSKTSLIQTMGRAARNIEGEVVIYAKKNTKSMTLAISEVERRRLYQRDYNKKHHIIPKSITKKIKRTIIDDPEKENRQEIYKNIFALKDYLFTIKPDSLTHLDKNKVVKKLERQMRQLVNDLNFEAAIEIRDKIRQLESIK